MIRHLSALFLAAVLVTPLPVMAQSLADTFVAAYRNSNLLDQNRALLRAADEDVAIAVASLRPVVNFATSIQGRTQTGAGASSLSLSFNLSADVTLIDFGRGNLAKEAAKAQVLATRQALVNVEQQVLFNAVSAYMDVRTATEAVLLQQATVRVITRELGAARERFELGEVTRTDVSLAEARLAAARSQLAASEGDLAAAREGYKLVTGSYPRSLRAAPALPRTAASLQAAQDIARRTHPNIMQAQFEVTAAEMNAERVAAQRHGSVTGSAGIGQSFSSATNDTTSLTAGITYARPIYQGGQLRALSRQALARRDASRAGLHQTVAQVLQNVGLAWANLDVTRARISASRQQVAASQSAFEGTREEARLGARTTLDVLNAENDLLNARTTLLQAEAGLQTATYNLLASMGLLTVDHLGLGITTYDPEAYYNAVKDAPALSAQGEALDRVLRALNKSE
ncbi:Outer membrane efflux protein BepC [Roseibaca ekhonensis]|uniref:Outer membrane efflux protein BepC n=1 Tax=Roseinatronobacter ekhonensis TaxID=254356 RepID=A0A3B0MKZ2_9RHOB|nr:TolC family outer membrane protein [Roseibaca ekhonensis]SUZ30299.1 Outer membrane efflux protein BepC [Roseibaca ekhonensis]